MRHPSKPQGKREPIACRIRMRAYPIISDAVEIAVGCGWNRAHKHTDEPEDHAIRTAIAEAVMSSLCEILDFDPEPIE